VDIPLIDFVAYVLPNDDMAYLANSIRLFNKMSQNQSLLTESDIISGCDGNFWLKVSFTSILGESLHCRSIVLVFTS